MSKTEKRFDSVAMMRSIRDKISAKIEGMTLEEELQWLASQEIQDHFLKRLRDRAAQQANQHISLMRISSALSIWVWLLFVDGRNILRDIWIEPSYLVGMRAYIKEK